MPALNRQTLINLLIDSPLREPIKINLIDIVNNTNDVDLPKTYSTISKELEIYQKATERRMKLAEETIAKLNENGTTPTADTAVASPSIPSSLPPLPPLPEVPKVAAPAPTADLPPMEKQASTPSLSVPPLDLPPLPTMKNTEPTPANSPLSEPVSPSTPITPVTSPVASTTSADEDALKEIQKELDALKTSASSDAAMPAPATTPQVQA